jgi:hypothetical protein
VQIRDVIQLPNNKNTAVVIRDAYNLSAFYAMYNDGAARLKSAGRSQSKTNLMLICRPTNSFTQHNADKQQQDCRDTYNTDSNLSLP